MEVVIDPKMLLEMIGRKCKQAPAGEALAAADGAALQLEGNGGSSGVAGRIGHKCYHNSVAAVEPDHLLLHSLTDKHSDCICFRLGQIWERNLKEFFLEKQIQLASPPTGLGENTSLEKSRKNPVY